MPAEPASNNGKFEIIDSTLREGERFTNASFDTETKIQIATALSDFGIDYIRLPSPTASEQSRKDCEAICRLGLKSKILTHVPCTLEDAKLACDTGVDGVDVVISPGKGIDYINETALEVLAYIKSRGVQASVSSEDAFSTVDLLDLYRAVDQAGVNRVGVLDPVGKANPRQVNELVRDLRGAVGCGIEAYFHNSTMAVANSHAAFEAGATHIDTSVLGIGENNGVTPLGALLARMIVGSRDYVTSSYKLDTLKELEELVAKKVDINVPFSNPVTGFCAFTHKAGIHSKAILNAPSTYEIIDPADFGVSRNVHFASRLTGWNAIKTRVEQLGLTMTDDQVKEVTQKIKAKADTGPLNSDDADAVIRAYHLELQAA